MQWDDLLVQRVFRESRVPMSVFGLDETYLDVNDAFCEFFGYPREWYLGRSVWDLCDPLTVDVDKAWLRELREGRLDKWVSTDVYPTADGDTVWSKTIVHLVPAAGDRPEVFFEELEDITGRIEARRLVEAARIETERIRTSTHEEASLVEIAFANALLPMAICYLDDSIIRVNDAFCALFGYPREWFADRRVFDVADPTDYEHDMEQLDDLRTGRKTSIISVERYFNASGNLILGETLMTAMPVESGQPTQYILQIRDITQALADQEARRVAEERLRHLADHDGLTGLLNRRAFEELFDRCLVRNALGRREATGAYLSIDLDSFKHHNDTYGHPRGDQILKAVARVLRDRLRETDVYGRIGGDEFGVVLPEAAIEDAERVAADLVDLIAKASQEVSPDPAHPVTVSIGIVDLSDAPEKVVAVHRADVALYAVKRGGKNGWARHTPSLG